MRFRNSPWVRGVALGLLLAIAGCSSTNETTQPLTAERSSAPNTTGTGADDPATTGDTGTGAFGTAADDGGSDQGPSGPGGTVGRVVTGGPKVVTGTVGVTATTIKLGVRYLADGDAFTAQMGINGDAGDTRAMAEAVVKHLNASGGIAGRKIVGAYRPYYASRAATREADHQAICEQFANDDKVFAVMSPIPAGAALPVCMAKEQTPIVQNAVGLYFDEQLMRETAGYLYTPVNPNASRAIRFWIGSLDELGYFGAKPKIGLVRLANVYYDRMSERDVKPALKRAGYQLDDEVVLTKPEDISAGVLRFRANGINRVLIIDDSSLVSQVWMPMAESQGYNPRYGMNSANGPQVLQKNVPKRQLVGAVGVGWAPQMDVGSDAEAGGLSAEGERCVALMKKYGVEMPTQEAKLVALYTCDAFLFTKRGVESSTAFTPAALRVSVEALNDTYHATGPFPPVVFGPGRFDGVAAVRDFAFNDGCQCFRYTSPVHRVP